MKWIQFLLAFIIGITASILSWTANPNQQILTVILVFGLTFLGIWLFLHFLISIASTLLSSLFEELDDLKSRIILTEEELRSMINVRPILKESVVGFGKWAVDARLAEQILLFLKEKRLNLNADCLVVECGSGTSTVLIARYLKQIGKGKIITLEHKKKFAAKILQDLREGNLTDVATVIEAPLRQWSKLGKEFYWYNFDPKTVIKNKIDLLIVDGPPGDTAPLARYPAVPMLKEWLTHGSVIILDDGNRNDERKIAEIWTEELNGTSNFYPAGKGTWVIRI